MYLSQTHIPDEGIQFRNISVWKNMLIGFSGWFFGCIYIYSMKNRDITIQINGPTNCYIDVSWLIYLYTYLLNYRKTQDDLDTLHYNKEQFNDNELTAIVTSNQKSPKKNIKTMIINKIKIWNKKIDIVWSFNSSIYISVLYTCNDNCIIHFFTCQECNKQNVGKTINHFRLRWNDYKNKCRTFFRNETSTCRGISVLKVTMIL